MSVGVVPEPLDERMPLEDSLDDATLNSSTASVNQSHLREACLRRHGHILLDDGRNIRRRERMKIEFAFDRNAQWIHAIYN